MERTPINPWSWNVALGFDQAQVIEGHQRLLVCSGQDAVDADGMPQHPGDMAAQLDLSLDNVHTVVTTAGLSFDDVVRLNIYTTDIDEMLNNFARITDRFAKSKNRFTTSVIGVARLPAPDLLVLLEVTAVA